MIEPSAQVAIRCRTCGRIFEQNKKSQTLDFLGLYGRLSAMLSQEFCMGCQMSKKDIVYVLTNEAMPGFVKIGVTTNDVEQRVKQLSSTELPIPFRVVHASKVNDAERIEKALHEAFADYRPNSDREFFYNLEPKRVIAVLKLVEEKDVTPTHEECDEDLKKMDGGGKLLEAIKNFKREKKQRPARPDFNFHEMGIPVGAELQSKDGKATATVAGDNSVKYDGEIQSMHKLTDKLFPGRTNRRAIYYWFYQGEHLIKIYNKVYKHNPRTDD